MKVKEIKPHESGSRIVVIESNGKIVNLPSYFPQITRQNDMVQLIEAMKKLEKMKKSKMPSIGGIVTEANTIPKVIKNNLSLVRQTRLVNLPRKNGEDFSSYYEFFKEYAILFLIDPNLDRIDMSSNYSDSFLKLGNDFLTTEIINHIKSGKSIGIDKLLQNIDAVRRILGFQSHYKADELIAPYISINAKSWQTNIESNTNLYTITLDVWKKFFPKYDKPIPVICLDKNVFNIASESNRMKMWESILDAYKELNVPVYIIKISDFDTSNKNEKYDIILEFFRFFKSRIQVPIILVNMNEFAYVLMREGMDAYSTRMSRRTNIDIPIAAQFTDEEREENKHGQYYIPRKMKLVKRIVINKIPLPCNCPFCSLYPNILVKKIPDDEWRDLRIYHYLWIKNDELRMLIEDLKKNSLRAALQSMFADSDGWKNFVDFVQ
jgi:hypothetical protein